MVCGETKDVGATFSGLNELERDLLRGAGSSLIVIRLSSGCLLIRSIA